MNIVLEKRLEILYDHYKDTFLKIQVNEKKRDRLFYVIIGFLGLLILQFIYSIALPKVVKQINILGFSFSFNEIPVPVIISLTWTFFSMIVIRYYQIIVHVDKQYNYLHELESKLSNFLDKPQIISRESSGYLTNNYSCFRHWVWIFYTAIYPAIIILAIFLNFKLEWSVQSIPQYHKIYDTILGVLAIITMVFYLVGNWFKK